MKKEEYLGRGIHNEKFLNALKFGKLKPMMDVINNDNQLDVQIRNNYLNIYYAGGNIAKVNSENSVQFDRKYFYTDMKNLPTKYIADDKLDELTTQRNDLIYKFKEGNFEEYFFEAKQVMDKWFAEKPNPERKEQHQLSIQNRFGKSDYTIIDIEYQVSTKSKFCCSFVPNGKSKPKTPRFDIIAVSKTGKLCIIELKKGSRALRGASGLKEHYKCYKYSIGKNHKPFMNEMRNLLVQKQDLKLINNQVKITSSEPQFMFAYSFDESDKKIQLCNFKNEYKAIGKNIQVIWLEDESWKLLDNNSEFQNS